MCVCVVCVCECAHIFSKSILIENDLSEKWFAFSPWAVDWNISLFGHLTVASDLAISWCYQTWKQRGRGAWLGASRSAKHDEVNGRQSSQNVPPVFTTEDYLLPTTCVHLCSSNDQKASTIQTQGEAGALVERAEPAVLLPPRLQGACRPALSPGSLGLVQLLFCSSNQWQLLLLLPTLSNPDTHP